MNKKIDIGLIVMLAVGLFLIRGIVNIGTHKEPVEDKMADIVNNSIQAEYYCNILLSCTLVLAQMTIQICTMKMAKTTGCL